jgi:hypothetical protein
MKRMNKMAPLLGGFSSGDSLGGKLSLYRNKQSIYTQGEPASTLFYIQEGACGSLPERNIKQQPLPRSWA